jgi:hypothetical protein
MGFEKATHHGEQHVGGVPRESTRRGTGPARKTGPGPGWTEMGTGPGWTEMGTGPGWREGGFLLIKLGCRS